MDVNSARSSTRASCYRAEMKLDLSSDSLDEEDYESDSLSEERKYQSEVQNRINDNDENLYSSTGDVQHGVTKDVPGYALAGAPNITPSRHQPYSTPQPTSRSSSNDSRPQSEEINYSELRYDPNWRKKQNYHNSSTEEIEEEEMLDEIPRYLDLLSPDVPAHSTHKIDTTEARRQNKTVSRSHQKPQNDRQFKQQANPTRKPDYNYQAGDITSNKSVGHQNMATADGKAVLTQQEIERKDFIGQNKATLGVRSQKTNSYLHLHNKKSNESTTDQNTRVTTTNDIAEKEANENRRIKMASLEEKEHINDNGTGLRSKDANIASLSSVVRKEPVWSKISSFSGYPRDESTDMDYFSPQRFSNVDVGPQEDPQIPNKRLVSWNRKAQEFILDCQRNGSWGSRRDPWDKHSGSPPDKRRPFQEEFITPPMTYTSNTGIVLPDQNLSLQHSASDGTTVGSHQKSMRDNKSIDSQKQTQNSRHVTEKNTKKLIDYLKQEVKLGGIGPSYIISPERMEQLRQQKEYARVIQECNRKKPVKVREAPIVQNVNSKGTRHKSLEYAKSIPRPQPSLTASGEKPAEVRHRRAMSYNTLFPHNKLLEELQARHEQEKVAAAAIRALHIV